MGVTCLRVCKFISRCWIYGTPVFFCFLPHPCPVKIGNSSLEWRRSPCGNTKTNSKNCWVLHIFFLLFGKTVSGQDEALAHEPIRTLFSDFFLKYCNTCSMGAPTFEKALLKDFFFFHFAKREVAFLREKRSIESRKHYCVFCAMFKLEEKDSQWTCDNIQFVFFLAEFCEQNLLKFTLGRSVEKPKNAGVD